MKYLKFIFVLAITGCLTGISPESLDFQDLLVVDARITDQFSFQSLHLSRTTPLDATSNANESGAQVVLEVNGNQQINFSEAEPGVYTSNQPFAALPGANYQLIITLANGELFQSSTEQLLETPPIDRLYGEFEPFVSNLEGSGEFSFYFDTQAGVDQTRKYLIEWSETYQVKVPFPSTFIWRGGSVLQERVEGDFVEICYVTEQSDRVIVQESFLESGRILRFPVRSFESFTQAMALRYSLEVRYAALSEDAFTYWQQLSRDQQSDAFFQQEQPGSIAGNIRSVDGSQGALGRFDVLSMQSVRNFYDPEDFSDDGFKVVSENIVECEMKEEFRTLVEEVGVFLTANPDLDVWFVESGLNTDPPILIPMVVYIARQCTNCTYYGSNVEPEFWVN